MHYENSFYLNSSISQENHSDHPNKHVHFWSQNIYNLDRTEMNSRASKIVRKIKDRISGLSLPRTTPGTQIPNILETRTNTSISKKTLCTQSKISKFSRSSKRISLLSKLEELDSKARDLKSFDLSNSFNKSLPESQTLSNLFNCPNILSESTIAKIQDFDRKIDDMRETLNNYKSKDANSTGFQKSRALKKFRVTQYFNKKLSASRQAKSHITII